MKEEALQILLIEDNPGDARLIEETLNEVSAHDYELTVAQRLQTGLSSLDQRRYDVLLLDLGLPDSQGMDTIVTASAAAHDVPIIVLTCTDDDQTAVDAVRHGAQDYLVKGTLDGRSLARSLRYAIERKRAQESAQVSRLFLEATNRHRAVHPLLRDFVDITRSYTGVDAVGIRVADSDGWIDYWAHAGFPQAFLAQESHINSRDTGCLCSLVATGDVPKESSCFSATGVCTLKTVQQLETDLPATVTSQIRGACQRFGYQSMALIPILSGNRRLGLIHAADCETGRLDWHIAQTLEIAALQLGAAMERARGVEAVSRSEARYRTLVDATSSVVWTTGPDGQFVEPQPSWQQITGQSWETSQGHGWTDAIHPDDRKFVTERIVPNPQNRAAFTEECRLWHQEKSAYRWFGARAAPVLGDVGDVVEWIATAEDIHARREAEAETASLEAQLRQSQRMEAVGRLAGGVAHDFNNLLTIIGGNAALIKMEPGEPTVVQESVAEIGKASQRAAALTRQLLAFSRKQVLQPRPLDLNLVVSDTHKMLRRLIGEDIELRIQCAPQLGAVRADPTQLEQVLMNLAVNARDAMPEGGTLTISTARDDTGRSVPQGVPLEQPGPCVVLSIADDGCGIDAATCERVFEPFYTTKEQGTGLGLSTVYGIVSQSGGTIDIQSVPGAGTTFQIRLPLVETSEPAEGIHQRSPTKGQTGTETVLIIEDEESVRDLVMRCLERSGYTVLCAGDGAGGVTQAREHSGDIQLLLTDVVMPGMSGRVAAERVQAIRPEVKVLFMSGYTDDAIMHHGVETEKIPFLPKPFSPRDLLVKIREILDDS